MRILVTGGHGFIGSHVLCQLVERGHTVGCFDLAGPNPVSERVTDAVTHYRGDVTDPVDVYDAVADFAPDRVAHLASLLGRESQADPRTALDINLQGTVHVLEAADTLDVERVVAASSVSAYGSVDSALDRLDETAIKQPRNVYGLTKFAVEHLGRTYRDQRGIEFAAIQPVHGIGPGRERGNVEDAFVVKAAVSGTALSVPDVGEPYELVHVEDEASAFTAAVLAEYLPNDAYLVGTGELITLQKVVDAVVRHVPEADVTLASERGDDELETLPPTDTSRIECDLDWTRTYDSEGAIAAYVDWLQANPDAWSFDPAAVPWSVSG